MTTKETIHNFGKELKTLLDRTNRKKNLTMRERLALMEIERLTKILRGERDPGGHMNSEMVRDAFGINRPTLHQWRQDGFPISTNDAVYMPDALRWLRKKWLEERAKKADDAMMVGDNSPALEQYRLYKAQIEKLNLEERQHKLVNYDNLMAAVGIAFSGAWSQIQRWSERLPAYFVNRSVTEIREKLIEETNRLGESLRRALETGDHGPTKANRGRPKKSN
jgi:phage terminase Nu1 subunit (DNA packaging protein)